MRSLERFVNTGTLRDDAASNDINAGITVDAGGTVDVHAGSLTVADVGVWPGQSPAVAAGALLTCGWMRRRTCTATGRRPVTGWCS